MPGNAPGLRHHASGPHTTSIKKLTKLYRDSIAELAGKTSVMARWSR
jgi:hypothetical protein